MRTSTPYLSERHKNLFFYNQALLTNTNIAQEYKISPIIMQSSHSLILESLFYKYSIVYYYHTMEVAFNRWLCARYSLVEFTFKSWNTSIYQFFTIIFYLFCKCIRFCIQSQLIYSPTSRNKNGSIIVLADLASFNFDTNAK